MNFTFDDEQMIYQETFRKFMTNECPVQALREVEQGEAGYAPEIWKKMAELEWLGLGLPDEYNNYSCDLVNACILCEEMGRVLLPAPYISTVILGGGALMKGGKEPVRDKIIRSIKGGECIISSAFMERERFEGIETSRCEASPGNSGYVINGVKTFVKNAHFANYILLTARTGEGVTVFLVDPKTPGVVLKPLQVMGDEKFFDVYLEDVRVDSEFILGEINNGPALLNPLIDRAKVALAARMIGSSDSLVDKSVQYAKDRSQFNKPIGSFQSIAFKLADMATEVSGARLLVYKAAWLLDKDRPAAHRTAAMAKAFVSDLYRLITDVAVHTYGGYGFMLEFDVQFYYRKAKAEEMTFGDATYNRKLINDGRLD